MSDMQLLTLVITLLAIGGAMYGNRKSVEDMRDVLRAESKTQAAEWKLDLDTRFGLQTDVLRRMENKLDHIVETLANHGERLTNLEKGGKG